MSSYRAAIVGGGPAGLMAADILSQAGVQVDVYDTMPSVGRKFLLAGIGGMNITHSEPLERFNTRYGDREPDMTRLLADFGPNDLCDWIHGLGIETFVGSSGRIFPTDMKAAPLLRAWLSRLREQGVHLHVRHRWMGWMPDGALCFTTPAGEQTRLADVTILALGGGSWARLGSDGAWVPWLHQRGVKVKPLQPANCGFDVNWTPHFGGRFAGEPLKTVALRVAGSGTTFKAGEFVITATGVEGSLIYAFSAQLRDTILMNGWVDIEVDLMPGWTQARLEKELSHPRGSRSLSSHMQSRIGLKGVKAGLLRECLAQEDFNNPARLAYAIKALPLRLHAIRPLDEAISSAGGVAFEAMDEQLMLRALPGVFCAGEMLDWEAPTGGYLLTGCFASGRVAGLGALSWLQAGVVA
ncbi:TIGR03862 family flavoprotein [Chitinivorax sp. B]|uniref:TIGR03862 family flavoprotein n=1 Tax=Chitinivorax sp. B TaxID=2502235 RepID=UPI0020183D37|nr:TIGR03862 family flavoprotein [Chitinivorax sp. B]